MFHRTKEPENWSDVNSLLKLLDEEKEGYTKLKDRRSLWEYRKEREMKAEENIHLFGGDFYAESVDSLGLPKAELEVLKEARDRGVKVKILGKWEPNSAKLIYWAGEYVNAEFSDNPENRKIGGRIELKTWGNGIRGGIFDREEAYVIQRSLNVPPDEITRQYAEIAPSKVVAESQITQEEFFPILALTTKSPLIVDSLDDRFKKEWEKSKYMKEDLALSQKPMTRGEDAVQGKVLNP
jgi:hypothetical protein